MTKWNYRALKRTYDSGEVEFFIHEVYYEKEKIVAISTNPISIGGYTIGEIKKTLKLMSEALKKEVLNYNELMKSFKKEARGSKSFLQKSGCQ